MTREEIMAMEAGKKLNLLVMEKVLGFIAWEEIRGSYTYIIFQKPEDREPYRKSRNWEKEMERYRQIEYSEINNHKHVVAGIKDYSSDISSAWEVLETSYTSEIKKERISGERWSWIVRFNGEMVISNSVPEAICKAALLAVIES